MSTTSSPTAEQDFLAPLQETPDGPRLVGGRCDGCGLVGFPRRARCGACGSADVRRHLLAPTGTLWTFTVQGFPPKSPPYVPPPGGFAPFGVGYVALDDGPMIESRLTESDPARLRIGAAMRLERLEVGDRELFAFAPVEDRA